MKRRAVIIVFVVVVVGIAIVDEGIPIMVPPPPGVHRVFVPLAPVDWWAGSSPLPVTPVPTPAASATPTWLLSPSLPCEHYRTTSTSVPSPSPASTVQVQGGVATYYARSWDWGRIARRNGVAIPGGVVPVAHWDCGKLGWRGTLYFPHSGHRYEIVVADCTAEADLALVLARGIVAEVPYLVAEAEGFVRAGKMPAVLVVQDSR